MTSLATKLGDPLGNARQALQLSRACHGLAGARRAHSPTEEEGWWAGLGDVPKLGFRVVHFLLLELVGVGKFQLRSDTAPTQLGINCPSMQSYVRDVSSMPGSFLLLR